MTTQNRGRIAVPWPLAGTTPAGGLAAEVYAGVAYIGDNVTSRWSGSQVINASATLNFEHSFDLALTSLRVRIYESGAELSESSVTSGFTIAEVSTDIISVTNTGGSPRTVEIYVEPIRRIRKADLDPNFDAVIEQLSLVRHSDSTSGTAVTATAASSSLKAFDNTFSTQSTFAGFTAPSPSESRFMIISNQTLSDHSLLNESGSASASDRIITGTGSAIGFSSDSSMMLFYDTVSSRWRPLGSGATGSRNLIADKTATATPSGVPGHHTYTNKTSIFTQATPTVNTYYDVTSLSISLSDFGVYDIHVMCQTQMDVGATGIAAVYTALRDGSGTVLQEVFSDPGLAQAASPAYCHSFTYRHINTTSPTTLKVSIKYKNSSGSPTVSNIYARGDLITGGIYIKAIRQN
jgi:hypothetical protein